MLAETPPKPWESTAPQEPALLVHSPHHSRRNNDPWFPVIRETHPPYWSKDQPCPANQLFQQDQDQPLRFLTDCPLIEPLCGTFLAMTQAYFGRSHVQASGINPPACVIDPASKRIPHQKVSVSLRVRFLYGRYQYMNCEHY